MLNFEKIAPATAAYLAALLLLVTAPAAVRAQDDLGARLDAYAATLLENHEPSVIPTMSLPVLDVFLRVGAP